MCEVLTLAGKKLAQGQMYQSHVPMYMSRLEKFSKTRGVASRIIFLIRDVMDMQRNDWIPRREKFTAKKIEEIHAEAETELGIQIKRKDDRRLSIDPASERHFWNGSASAEAAGDKGRCGR